MHMLEEDPQTAGKKAMHHIDLKSIDTHHAKRRIDTKPGKRPKAKEREAASYQELLCSYNQRCRGSPIFTAVAPPLTTCAHHRESVLLK